MALPDIPTIVRWMRDFESKHNALSEAVEALRADRGGADRSRLLRGAWWTCEGCGRRLGVIEDGTLRIQMERGEARILVVPGRGGETRVTCRGCARENVLRDDPAVPTGPAGDSGRRAG